MKQLCYQAIDSSKVRNFQMKLKFADESWRYVLLPFYLASYSFGGKSYQVLLNGQTGTVAGKKLVNWQKIWRFIGISLFPGTFLSLLGLTLGKIGQVDLGPIGIVGLVLGGIVSYYLYSTGKQLESA
ncbi:MAG: hypothetical protein AAF399_17900 [Bacteroidota bacterium]